MSSSDDGPGFQKLDFHTLPPEEMARRASDFQQLMGRRRSVREFAERPVPGELIRTCIRCAGSAPSGANRQPWHFAVVTDPVIKRRIRESAEAEEKTFYGRRAPDEWLEALAPLGTNANKPFLENAPCLIVIFARKFTEQPSGKREKNYYVTESASIATGFLIAALHNAGLATLTHTPSPMKFLNQILGRPETEKPLMVLVTGYPVEDARVPDISRKPLEEIASFHGE